jgi:hypothetical protein
MESENKSPFYQYQQAGTRFLRAPYSLADKLQ